MSKIQDSNSECKLLPNGDVVLSLFNVSKKLADTLARAAFLNKDITIQDLHYQYEAMPEASFRDILIAAGVFHAIKELFNKKSKIKSRTKKVPTKRPKIKKNLRNNPRGI